MATETIDIKIRSDGARVVKRELEGIGEGASSSGQMIGQLKGLLAGLAGSLLLNQLRQYADQWTEISNRIRLNTSSTTQAAAVQSSLFDAAQRTRTEFKTLVQLYGRAAQSGKQLGTSQGELIKFSEGVGMALAIQGVSAESASGALLQLGQMLGSTRIQAEEFNSINEAAPRILQAAANNIKATGGSVSQLKRLVAEGKVSNKQFFEAFMKDMPKLRAEFEKANPTIGQAFTVLNNAIGKFVGEGDQAAGVSTTIARGIMALGGNLPTIAKALVAVGAGMLVAFNSTILGWINKAVTAIRGFTAALASNPIGAIAVALTVVVTALVMFRDELTLVTEGSITLGDYMRALWSYVADALTFVGGLISDYVVPAIASMWEWFQNGGSIVAQVFRFIVNVVKDAVNTQIGLLVAFVKTAVAVFKGLPDALKDLFFSTLNIVIDRVEWALNKIIEAVNALREFAGLDPLAILDLGRLENSAAGAAADLGESIKLAFISSLSVDYIGSMLALGQKGLDALTAKARQFAKERQALENKPSGDTGLNNSLGGGGTKQASAELAEYNRELDHKIKLLGMEANAREIADEIWKLQNKLQKDGIVLSQEETAKLKEKLTTLQQLSKLDEDRQRMLEDIKAPHKALVDGQAALNALLAKGSITLAEYNAKLLELKLAAGEGSFADGFVNQLNVMSTAVTNFAARAGEQFATLTNSLIDGLATATARAIVFGENFKDAVGNMARNALADLIAALIKIGIQMLLNQALGTSAAAVATASNAAMAASSATAWAPAAALASLATLGANAAPASAAITGTMALTESMTAASIAGFESGGYTGDIGRKEIAGVVHGREFVVNADATMKNRATLEAMNRGSTLDAPTSDVSMNVTVENNTPASISVERLSPTDIRIIAREEAKNTVRSDAPAVVAADLSNPNSRTSRAITQNTTSQRRRS